MLTKLRANPEFVLTFLIAFATMLLYIYAASSRAEQNAMKVTNLEEKFVLHCAKSQDTNLETAKALAGMKQEMRGFNKSMDERAKVQEEIKGKLENLNDTILEHLLKD